MTGIFNSQEELSFVKAEKTKELLEIKWVMTCQTLAQSFSKNIPLFDLKFKSIQLFQMNINIR